MKGLNRPPFSMEGEPVRLKVHFPLVNFPLNAAAEELGNVKVDIALPVPEPGTLTMLGTGLLLMAGLVRRKRSLAIVSR